MLLTKPWRNLRIAAMLIWMLFTLAGLLWKSPLMSLVGSAGGLVCYLILLFWLLCCKSAANRLKGRNGKSSKTSFSIGSLALCFWRTS